MSIEIVYQHKGAKKIAKFIASKIDSKMYEIINAPKFDNAGLLVIVAGDFKEDGMLELNNYASSINRSMVRKVVLISTTVSEKTNLAGLKNVISNKSILVPNHYFTCTKNSPSKLDKLAIINYIKTEMDNSMQSLFGRP